MRDMRNTTTKAKQPNKRVRQDVTLLLFPLLNGTKVVFALEFSNVEEEGEEDAARFPVVDILVGPKGDAVSFPIVNGWLLLGGLLWGTLAKLALGSRSELAVGGARRESAVALEYSRDADMVVGVDFSCVLEADIEMDEFVPIDADAGSNGSGTSVETPFIPIKAADVNGSDVD